MSVLKAKRKSSQFEVFHHFYKTRKEITDLLLRDFGYDLERAEKRVAKLFGGKPYEELTPEEKVRYDKLKAKNEAFDNWFIEDERKCIVDCLREITKEVFTANSIYPTVMEELVERRLCQDRAIGQCYRLTQELQYAIETLPVDVNKYLRFADMIQTEINLIKGWRKSDNKRAISDSASNFANVNNNGNANYNNASNSNGVRPDFDSAIE
jgi:hypothetical protein